MAVGQAAEEDSVDDTEDGRRRADSEHQRENDCEREGRVAAKTAKRVMNILQKCLGPVAGALFPTFLSGALDASEGDGSLPSRFIRGHSGGDVGLDLFFEVEA